MNNFFFSLDTLQKLDKQGKLYKFISEIPNTNIIGVSRSYTEVIQKDNNYGLPRKNFDSFIINHPGKRVYIGDSDQDFFTAVNSKTLLLVPTWINEQHEGKALTYGIQMDTEDQLIQMLQIFSTINTLFYELKVDDLATVYALTDANKVKSSPNELEVINKFRATLKYQDSTNLDALKLILSAGLSGKDEFENTDIWAIMPSSGTEYNSEMMNIKEKIKYQFKGRYDTTDQPLIIRYKPVGKSHLTPRRERLHKGAAKHLESIHLNPYYRHKLKDKVVTVLDDYVTNGISFESIRNLLKEAEVKQVNFIAIGRFHNSDNGGGGIYQKEDYVISGDIYQPCYEFKLCDVADIGGNGVYNNAAKEAMEEIRNIL